MFKEASRKILCIFMTVILFVGLFPGLSVNAQEQLDGDLFENSQIGRSQNIEVGKSGLPLGVSAGLFASNPLSYIFDISEGNIIIKKGTAANTLSVVYGSNITSPDIPIASPIKLIGKSILNNITIDGSGVTGTIKVISEELQINLSADNDGSAFRLINGANVEITFAGYVNTRLTSGIQKAGLRVGPTEKLTINSADGIKGVEAASSNQYAGYGLGNGAGVGGDEGEGSGQIIIKSGLVNAFSGYGAGIGGGGNTVGSNGGNAGYIEISGGRVTGYSSIGGAGIGGGYGQTTGGSVNGLLISGGTISAVGIDGAAIGGGSGGTTGGDANGITISGGTFPRAMSTKGAGIGGGFGVTTGGSCNNTTISGGSVKASSNSGAGIGGGFGNTGGNMGIINISGASTTIETTSYSGGGIGGGAGTSKGGDCGVSYIVISDATVNAISTQGAGVGGGSGALNGLGENGTLNNAILQRTIIGVGVDTVFTGQTDNQENAHKVTVKVTDTNGNPLSDVDITIEGRDDIIEFTDANGEAFFQLLKPDAPTGPNAVDYIFVLTKSGYQPAIAECVDVTLDPTIIVQLTPIVGRPTVTAMPSQQVPETTSDIVVNLNYIPGANGNIAESDKRFAITNSTDEPTAYTDYQGPINISTDGEWYIHYAVKDPNYNNGEFQTGYFGPYLKGSVIPSSSEKRIRAFSINGVNGTIRANRITVVLPYNTDIASLTPDINYIGKTLSPAPGSTLSFVRPVTYRVTAEDGTYLDYIVTVTTLPSADKQITYFSINGVEGEIVGTDIYVTLPYGTDLTNLRPVVEYIGDFLVPASGEINNFTTPAMYTVFAANGTSQDYMVYVTVEPQGNIIEPYVISENPMILYINGKNQDKIFVSLGLQSNHVDDLTNQADIFVMNPRIAGVDSKLLLKDGNVIVTGLSEGITNITITFSDSTGVVDQYTKIITVIVYDDGSAVSYPDSGSSDDYDNNGTTQADKDPNLPMVSSGKENTNDSNGKIQNGKTTEVENINTNPETGKSNNPNDDLSDTGRKVDNTPAYISFVIILCSILIIVIINKKKIISFIKK